MKTIANTILFCGFFACVLLHIIALFGKLAINNTIIIFIFILGLIVPYFYLSKRAMNQKSINAILGKFRQLPAKLKIFLLCLVLYHVLFYAFLQKPGISGLVNENGNYYIIKNEHLDKELLDTKDIKTYMSRTNATYTLMLLFLYGIGIVACYPAREDESDKAN